MGVFITELFRTFTVPTVIVTLQRVSRTLLAAEFLNVSLFKMLMWGLGPRTPCTAQGLGSIRHFQGLNE